jgi:hypothetical protein
LQPLVLLGDVGPRDKVTSIVSAKWAIGFVVGGDDDPQQFGIDIAGFFLTTTSTSR